MNPEALNALVNMGSAGAVIAVVIIFLRSSKERDAEWRSFFTTLAGQSTARLETMRTTTDKIQRALDDLISKYDEHDGQAREIKQMVQELRISIERLNAPTIPRKGSARQQQ